MAITTDYLEVLGIVGHSNGFGLAGVNEMLVAYPHLLPGQYPLTDVTKQVYKNIYVFTSAHGYSGADGTPPTHTAAEGEWLEMTTNNPSSPAAPHPHPSPYAYPNNLGIPLPNWLYDASLSNPSLNRGSGTFAGIEIPLMWKLSQYWADQVGMFKVSAPGSLFLRFDVGFDPEVILDPFSYINSPAASRPASVVNSADGYYNWYTPAENFDWSQSTERLYESAMTKALAAKASLPTGTTMNMGTWILWFGDNDANRSSPRVMNWEQDMRQWIARFRQDLVDNELTVLPAHQVRIVLMGTLPFYDTDNEGTTETINEAYAAIAADDPYVRFVDTTDLETHDDDAGHLTYQGYIDATDLVMAAIEDMDVAPYDALDTSELITVSEAMDRVRLYYSRGQTQTDAKDNVLLAHLNASMHHIINQCGDYADWLRRRTEITLSGSARVPTTMPKVVHRVVNIEALSDPTFPIQFEMVGHTDGGRVQLMLPECTNGDYVVHYIRTPPDLSRMQEKIPIPKELLEWLIAETCFRLSRAASQTLQMSSWAFETNRLNADALKNLTTRRRARRERLYTQRRLPDVLGRRGRRRWGLA